MNSSRIQQFFKDKTEKHSLEV